MRCVAQVPLTTWALAASAASASPRATVVVESSVRVPGIDLGRPVAQRLFGAQHGLQHLVLDLDERRGRARRRFVLGGHRRQHVADAAHLLADGDEAGPVVVDQPVPALARHVGRRDHGRDAGQRRGRAGVDRDDPGAGVGGERNGAVQQPRPRHVVHVRPVAEGQLAARVARQRGADAAVRAGSGVASPRRACASSSMASRILT